MNKRIAILATDGFEESELKSPMEYLKENGFEPEIVSLKSGMIKSWADKNWGKEYKVDTTVDTAKMEDYRGLVLPGGQINPDLLRVNEDAVAFVKAFAKAGKPIAAICHGPWTLISAGVVKGRKMTSYKSIKDDMINAGANWVDEEVVVDKGLVTSRDPNDLPAFNKKMVEEFREGKHEPMLT